MRNKRFALCIGNNDYQSFDKLKYSINDKNRVFAYINPLFFNYKKQFFI